MLVPGVASAAAVDRIGQDGRMRGRTPGDPSSDRNFRSDWWGVVLEAPDGRALARFYADLLGWEMSGENPDGAALAPADGVAYLATQTARNYQRPVWPAVEGRPQITAHLDFEVSDLETAVADAVRLGAELAPYQPQDNVRVMLDPAGHAFCLYVGD